MFEVFHGVERILQWFGDILLDILCRGTRIHRYDHYRVCVDIRIKVDREFRKGKETEDDDSNEAKRRHHRSFYC